MKNYSKQYEDVFTSERTLKKCNLKLVGIDKGLDLDVYTKLMKETIREYELMIWDKLVKLYWLKRRFCYRKKRREKTRNGTQLDRAYGVFMRSHIGFEHKLFFVGTPHEWLSYVFDFYPEFDAMDPFRWKIEFPYKNIGLSHLSVVWIMEERLELLRYAEENSVPYDEFLDYVINYINCYNDEVNKKHYIMTMNIRPQNPHVRIFGKKVIQKTPRVILDKDKRIYGKQKI